LSVGSSLAVQLPHCSRAGCSAASLQHPLIQTDIENYNMESLHLPGGLYHTPRGHRLGGVLMEVVRLKLNCFLRLSSLTRATTGAPRSVLPGPLLDGLQACRWCHLWRT